MILTLTIICASAWTVDEGGVSFPDPALAAAVPITQAGTEVEAWSLVWRDWLSRKLVSSSAPEQVQQTIEQMAPGIVRLAGNSDMTPTSLLPLADFLISQNSFAQPAGRQAILAIAHRLVTQPCGDKIRVGTAREIPIISNADAVAKAIMFVDACGGPQTCPEFYQTLLNSPRWRSDVTITRVIEQHFLQDHNLCSMWLDLALASPPETWGADTTRWILKPEWGTAAERSLLLERAVIASLKPVVDPTAIDLRTRILIDFSSNKEGQWDGLLSETALTNVVDACGSIDDTRLCALPWLMLLGGDVSKIRAGLSKNMMHVIAWSTRLDEHGFPLMGLCSNVKVASRKPWTAVMPVLPFAFIEGELDEQVVPLISRFQSMGIDPLDPSRLAQLGHPELATKAALAAIVAQHPTVLASWWKDPDVRFDLQSDPMFIHALAPWACLNRIPGPWWLVPAAPGRNSLLAQQYAVIMRSGSTTESLDCLRTSLKDKNSGSLLNRSRAWAALCSDPAIAAEFAAAIRPLLPQQLHVHPISQTTDLDAAAELIDLHREFGQNEQATELAREASRIDGEARKRALKLTVAVNQPSHGSSSLEADHAVSDQLAKVPWIWNPVYGRLLLLDRREPNLTLALELIKRDTSAVAIFARWIIANVVGEEAGEFPIEAYLAAARDPRFVALLDTMALLPDRFVSHAEVLRDPRIIRGWCMGPPGNGWMGSEPKSKPIVELLTIFTRLRLFSASSAGENRLPIP